MRLWLAVVLAALAMPHLAPQSLVAAECCWPVDPVKGLCADGTKVNIFSCCGVGACNAACCNCEKGCRSGSGAEKKRAEDK